MVLVSAKHNILRFAFRCGKQSCALFRMFLVARLASAILVEELDAGRFAWPREATDMAASALRNEPNSGATDALNSHVSPRHVRFFGGFFSRRPCPPPFSSMNSTPAASSACASVGLRAKAVDGDLEHRA
jgi:hypothetical protein